jgi:hypothetical protein
VNYVDIDLHKKTIVLCVLDQHRHVIARRSLACGDPEAIVAFFRELQPFQAVVEATASYEWLVELIEPLADQDVLANASQIYEIAHSKRKTDHHDAQVLAEKLAEGKVPLAHRPTPRQREHRTLVRHRPYLNQCVMALKVKMRRIATRLCELVTSLNGKRRNGRWECWEPSSGRSYPRSPRKRQDSKASSIAH